MEQNGRYSVAEVGEGFERVEEVGLDCEIVRWSNRKRVKEQIQLDNREVVEGVEARKKENNRVGADREILGQGFGGSVRKRQENKKPQGKYKE